ncbi:sulfotransferase family protein [Oscillatoria salina]|uniref:sulfotransferase family protein n=1 Tax=Oscillatoria salina TaxID=331517 RepID=UPI001CCC4857|nr:sulfotransferase [Oscillatoria salina]MBZ8179401.1 sulfotransferase [Oscillatoria salina IIICB1]
MKQPSFFIVGAPKSGTTALCKYLAQHPEIFIPPAKELNYFNTDLNPNRKAKNLTEYLALFTPGEGKVCGEGSTSYLRSKNAAQEIKAFNPQAKIIIMLREPVSLLYSFHSQNLYNGNSEDIQDFQLAMETEFERRQGKKIPSKCTNPEILFYRNIVNFTEQIQRYFDTFGRERVKIILFDDYKQDTAKTFREILEFLEVNPNFSTEFTAMNSNKKVRSTILQQLVKYPPSKILEIGKYFLPLPRQQRRAILEKLKGILKKANTEKTTRKPLNPEFQHSLQQEFAPEVERLSQLLGRDLTHWRKNN